ncbi:hypothetical protein ACW0JT_03000 [Arthrobacter sp. SA17]
MDSENIRTTPARDVPEADLVEQQLPVSPDESQEPDEQSTSAQIPSEAPEADYLEQHVSAVPGREGEPRSRLLRPPALVPQKQTWLNRPSVFPLTRRSIPLVLPATT